MLYAPIDIVFAVLILIITIRAMLRGLVHEISGIAWLVLGLLFSLAFFRQGAVFIREQFNLSMNYVPEVLSFAALFLIVFIVVKILTAIVNDIITRLHLSGIDRFLGVIFGIAEGLAIVALILFVLDIQPLFDKSTLLDGSLFNHLLEGSLETVQDMIAEQ